VREILAAQATKLRRVSKTNYIIDDDDVEDEESVRLFVGLSF
jgi:hypothetical protein